MPSSDFDSSRILDMNTALEDFHQARRQATLGELLARLRGQPASLLSFDEVRQKLKAQPQGHQILQDIPVSAIIGSVNRYEDFTRDFLPRDAVDEKRWAGVQVAAHSMQGLPPIEVYQVGDIYFVSDGNHRVSVARSMGVTHIQAYVTQVHTRIPISPDTRPADLARMAEFADFLEATALDATRPQADLSVSELGAYCQLLEHISVHRYYMGLEQQREISFPEAAAHWYDAVYLPVIQVVRERGLLQDFPGRTEADLYLWLARYRSELEEQLGQRIESDQAAQHLAQEKSPRRGGARLGERVFDALVPDVLEPGPPPGEWRRAKEAGRRSDRLFNDILVAVNGQESGWQALEQALVIARQEGSYLNGLHVMPEAARKTDLESLPEQAVRLQQEFEQRCAAAGQPGSALPGSLALAQGDITRTIISYAAWSDLVVLSLEHPPQPGPLARLGSGLLTLVQRCPRPILAVPGAASPLSHALLAYDGSPKAREALYVATYLAGKWNIPLDVVTILREKKVTQQTAADAETYLQSHGVQASYHLERSQELADIAPHILRTAAGCQADLIIMGGYGITPLQNVLQDNIVDQVLRQAQCPVLLCR